MGTPPESDPRSQLSLPPGFRFYPTDEELIVNYLCNKIAGHHFSLQVIGDVDLYKFDPWDLPSKALFGEKEWYFFSPRDRKYPNGSRPNRVAGSGYWKATGTDKMIGSGGRKAGIKKALVFYVGKAPKGRKTNWIMHEYRLSQAPNKIGSTSAKLDDWVLCRIYKKKWSGQKAIETKDCGHDSSSSSSSQYGEALESLPEINDPCFSLPRLNSLRNLQQLGSVDFDWATLSGLNSIGPDLDQAQHQNVRNSGNNMSSLNDICAPVGVGVVDEIPRWPENQNPTSAAHNYYYSTSADPFGAQPGDGIGFLHWRAVKK